MKAEIDTIASVSSKHKEKMEYLTKSLNAAQSQQAKHKGLKTEIEKDSQHLNKIQPQISKLQQELSEIENMILEAGGPKYKQFKESIKTYTDRI